MAEESLHGSLPQFVMKGKWLKVNSSNVDSAHFDAPRGILTILYRNGSYYQYFGVTPDEALDFAAAPSKGQWIWDNLRVRGTKTGYQKEYVKIF
jgi:hypothetical protein